MNFNELMKSAYPATAPTADVQNEVGRKLRAGALQKRRLAKRKLTIAGATLTTLLVTGGILVGPTAIAVYKLNKIVGSVGDVDSAVLEQFRVGRDGTLTLEGRTIYDRGRWRLERGEAELSIFEGGTLWSYEEDQNRVVVRKNLEGPFTHNPSGFSVKAMLSDMARWNWRQKISSDSTVVNGKRYDRVILSEDSDRERRILLADQQTGFPVEFRLEAKGVNGWKLRGVSKPKFNVKVDQKLFARDFPKTAKFVDLEKELLAWAENIKTPLAEFTIGKRTIQIREISLNSRGHLFVIYSDGETAADRKAYTDSMRNRKDGELDKIKWVAHPDWEATDGRGKPLLESPHSLQPYVGYKPGSSIREVVLADGQVLQGAWFLPGEDGKWAPGEFKFKLQLENETAEWVYNLPEPNSPLLPDWMSNVVIGPRNEREIYAAEREAYMPLLKNRGDWEGVYEQVRAKLDEIMEDERKGQSYAKGGVYYELYNALIHLGRRQEALEYLKLAADEPMYPNQYPKPEIEKALKKEGLR